jgi:RNA polymerase sigma-70 factor, ECF subfamily
MAESRSYRGGSMNDRSTHRPEQDDAHDVFMRLFLRYERNIRAFLCSLLPTQQDVDEVMQNTSMVLWKKFDQFDTDGPERSFLTWAFVIARFEVLYYRRRKATDRLLFDEDILEKLAEEAAEEDRFHEERLRAMRTCIAELTEAQQRLLKASYAQGTTIKAAAKRVGRTPTGLYKTLRRIREKLFFCIESAMTGGVS